MEEFTLERRLGQFRHTFSGVIPSPSRLFFGMQVRWHCRTKEFHEFEKGLSTAYRIRFQRTRYPSHFAYMSSLFLADMLDVAFRSNDIRLPEKLLALDIGAGQWSYAKTLSDFLQHYRGEREVHLDAVDPWAWKYRSGVHWRMRGIPHRYFSGSVQSIQQKKHYDVVFIAHMLTNALHAADFGLIYTPQEEIFDTAYQLLRKDGLLIAIAYEDEYFLRSHPSDKKIFEQQYCKDVGSLTDFLGWAYTFNRNYLLLGKK